MTKREASAQRRRIDVETMLKERTGSIYYSMAKRARSKDALLPFGIKEFREAVDKVIYTPCPFSGELLTPANLSADHAIPISRGGSWELDNICFAVAGANCAKGKLTASEYQELLKLLNGWEQAAKSDVLMRLKLAGTEIRSRFGRR